MASTREIVSYVLQNDKELKAWFEEKHGFTLEKAISGELESYQDLINVIIWDGVNNKVISQAQADGIDNL